ncbi:RING/U-box superfamily protein [Actinidia rufa]|uniref:RING-type E3 ubiquitin transferase n=1 Tax=Actinidia rufa TaxID=165716 RepID=A0A7J0GX91_9ERIC|nr:RING/U-box superfamily protein [Actinidia rufa]
MENLLYMWYFRRRSARTPVGTAGANGGQGLDPITIQSFPTFPYSSVKDLRKEKYGLECAICLSEFLDDDILRLLTTCCHVFHQECIDLWLESHKTCPVCRRSLDTLEKSPTNYSAVHEIDENEPNEDTFSITIKDDNDQDGVGKSDRAENLAEQRNDAQTRGTNFQGHIQRGIR